MYHQNYFKFIGIDLSKGKNSSISQQTDFIGKLEEDNSAAMFFLSLKTTSIYFKLFFRITRRNRLI